MAGAVTVNLYELSNLILNTCFLRHCFFLSKDARKQGKWYQDLLYNTLKMLLWGCK